VVSSSPSAELVAAYVLRKRKGATQLLLLKRPPDCPYAPLTWQIVYGHREDDEGSEATILREIIEETGITPKALYSTDEVFSIPRQHTDGNMRVPVYVAFVDNRDIVVLNDEHVAFKWIDVENAGEDLYWPVQKKTMKNILREFCEKEPSQKNII
jgi:dihydroneopterin triphosphate diphosphatase